MEHHRAAMHQNDSISMTEHYQKGLSAFCTPPSPQQSNTYPTFAWPFPTGQNQQVRYVSYFFFSNISLYR